MQTYNVSILTSVIALHYFFNLKRNALNSISENLAPGYILSISSCAL
ncbi:Uncharacterised protein [Providencia heimbachae]|nr:Uncharacterised protein [Providencia heimbachae]